MPVTRNFTIDQGETLALPFYWYAGDPVIKPITGATKTFPPVITAVAHGLPTDQIPVQIYSVGGMTQLNYVSGPKPYALKLTADTFSLPAVNAAGYGAYTSGGYLEYTPPQDLTGYTARMQIRQAVSSATFLLELTTANSRLVLGGVTGKITVALTDADTAALNFTTAVYDLELVSGAGDVTRLASGKVTLSKEVTR